MICLKALPINRYSLNYRINVSGRVFIANVNREHRNRNKIQSCKAQKERLPSSRRPSQARPSMLPPLIAITLPYLFWSCVAFGLCPISNSTNTLNKSIWFFQKVSFFFSLFLFIVILLRFYLHNICVIGLLSYHRFILIYNSLGFFSFFFSSHSLFCVLLLCFHVFFLFFWVFSLFSCYMWLCVCLLRMCFSLDRVQYCSGILLTILSLMLCCWCMLSSMNKLCIYFVYFMNWCSLQTVRFPM